MDKKRILILGAGISGLSAAWYLSELQENYEVVVLEKSPRSGGYMETKIEQDFLFEKGPRIFKTSRSKALLDLIDDLGLSHEVITSSKEARYRYIWWEGKLRKFPTNPLSFIFSPLTRPLVCALLGEWRKPPLAAYDESIWDFAVRRFNEETAERLFDPLIMGIFTGDIRKLSVRSCLNFLRRYEENFGSVTSGFLHSLKEKKKKDLHHLPSNSLFSFKKGASVLIEALIQKSPAKILYDQDVKKIRFTNDEVLVVTQDTEWKADAVFCALPVRQTLELFQELDEEVAEILSEIPTESITSVNVGFHQDVLQYKGFGYLVPSTEKLNILGAVFDSHVFPEQNTKELETRLTVKIRGDSLSKEEILQCVHKSLKEHLHIEAKPDIITIKRTTDSLPQFLVGHGDRIAFLKRKMQAKFPRCYLAGNYLTGISVNDCIARSKSIAMDWVAKQAV